MDNKRFLLFVVLSIVIWAGYWGLQALFFPPPPPKPKTVNVEKLIADLSKDEPRQVLAWIAAHPVPASLHLPFVLPNAKDLAAKKEELRKQAAARKAADAPPQVAVKPAGPDEDIVLGGEEYRLKAVLSKQGGAVRRITLNAYKAAHEDDAKPFDRPLILVNDNDDEKLDGLDWDARLKRQSFQLLVDEAGLNWQVREKSNEKVVFEAAVKNVRIVKTFELKLGHYHLGMTLRFERIDPDKAGELVYELTGPRGLPVEGMYWKGTPYRQVVFAAVDTQDRRSIERTMQDPKSIHDEKAKPFTFEGPDAGKSFRYAGVIIQYFSALAVLEDEPNGAPGQHIHKVTPEYLGDDEKFRPNHSNLMGKVSPKITSFPVKPAEKPVEHRYVLFAGPSKVLLLDYEKNVAANLSEYYGDELQLRTLTDYPETWIGKRGFTIIFVFFTDVMHRVLEWFHKLGSPYWLAIILLTVVVRGAMFPITRKQALASQRMQGLGPEIQKLKEKHKNDRQALAQAQMQLYRTAGVNPLSGCLIVFLQLPIFMGLYYALNESTHLRLESFLWIKNLAAPDMLFWWGDNAVTQFLGVGPYFNLLPIIAISLMFVQQKLVMPPPIDDQAALNMKIMNFMMIFMAYMFYWVPSGLCLYFTVSSGWGILERKLLPKRTAKVAEPPRGDDRRDGTGNGQPPRPRGGPGKVPARIGKDGAAHRWSRRLADWWSNLLEQAKKK